MAWVKSGNGTMTQTTPAYMNRTELMFWKRRQAGLTRNPTPRTYVEDKRKVEAHFGKSFMDIKAPEPTIIEKLEYERTTSPKMRRVAAAKKTVKSITQKVITKVAPLSAKKPFVGFNWPKKPVVKVGPGHAGFPQKKTITKLPLVTATVQAVPQVNGGRGGISGMIIGIVLVAIALAYVVLKKVL